MAKNLPTNAGDTKDCSLIPGSERFPGVGNGNLLQYSCLENSTERGAWQAPWGHKESDTAEHKDNPTSRNLSYQNLPTNSMIHVQGIYCSIVCKSKPANNLSDHQ